MLSVRVVEPTVSHAFQDEEKVIVHLDLDGQGRIQLRVIRDEHGLLLLVEKYTVDVEHYVHDWEELFAYRPAPKK